MNLLRMLLGLIIIGLFMMSGFVFSQEKKVKWQRSDKATDPDLQLFHSPRVVDLPTATTLQKWNVEFEISHRFIPTTGSGIDDLYGIDGPVNMRLALGLAVSNSTIITLGKSNFNDNIDLWVKQKFLQVRHEVVPFLVAGLVGGAWNSNTEYDVIANRPKIDSRNFQAFGQLILNTMLKKRLGIGLVPSYLYNTDIRFENETKDTFRLGTYLQYYVSPWWSIFVEWAPYISGYRSLVEQEYNPFTYGIELETGGHFFKILLTNSKYLNSSQYLAGADIPADRNDWRLGFMITRLLKFGK